MKNFIERNHVGLLGKSVHDVARRLASLDPSELRSNVEICKKTLIIEKRIERPVRFYRRLIEHYA